MDTHLRVEHLEVRYGDLVGIADVSLEVQPGSVVALLGSNGAGKTTTLNADRRAGARRAAARSHWRGEAIGGEPAYAIVAKGLALSPEGWRLFVAQTVEQNLRLGATALADKGKLAGAARARLSRCFRASPSGARSSPARSRAASGRCWRSAAR